MEAARRHRSFQQATVREPDACPYFSNQAGILRRKTPPNSTENEAYSLGSRKLMFHPLHICLTFKRGRYVGLNMST